MDTFDDFDWSFSSGGGGDSGAGIDWSQMGTEVVQAGARTLPSALVGLYGQNQIAGANRFAAGQAAGAAAANIAEIRAANQRAAAKLRPISAQAGPALDYFRGVVARNPYDLMPAQQIELQDRARIAKNSISPGLRGSARVNTAMVNDVVNRGRAGMISENQRRSDVAAGTLGTAGVNATTNEASIESGQGPQIAAQNLTAAQAAGNAATGTAASSADTMGTIASFFANSLKDQERESRYQRFKEGGV